MLSTILIRVIFLIFVTPLWRAIASIIKFDDIVLSIIQRIVTVTPENLRVKNAIVWGASGVLGLICLFAWIYFHAEDRIYDLYSPRPGLGTLSYGTLIDRIELLPLRNKLEPLNQHGDVEITVILHNDNDATIAFHGRISASANGKEFESEKGMRYVEVSGFVARGKDTNLVVKITDVELTHKLNEPLVIAGKFSYDLSYYFPPNGRTRRTYKAMAFSTPVAGPFTPEEKRKDINVLFNEEKEE
jgi:hypothetical protein